MTENTNRWLILIILLAIGLRAGAVLVLQSHRVPRSTYEHGEIAANLLAGRGFSTRFLGADGPTSQQAPVYPVLVAAAYAIGGVETPRALLLLELGQAVLGGVLVLYVFRLARLLAPEAPGVALAAGILTAVHPTLVYAATHVQVALLGATLLTMYLYLAFRTGLDGKALGAAQAGGILALLALTDPILSLAGVGGIWSIFQGRKGGGPESGASRRIAIMMLTAALGVTPWIVRNAIVHGELVVIKSSFGYAFWQGNCAISEGTDKVVRGSVEKVLERSNAGDGLEAYNRTLWRARHEAGYIDDIALSREEVDQLGQLTEPRRSGILFARAIQDLRERPGRYLSLCLRRFRYFWLFDETNPKTRSLVYRVGHLGLTILSLLGLALSGPELRRKLWPLIAVAACISLFHTLTIVSARFHIPIEPLMAIGAGAVFSIRGPVAAGSASHRDHVVGIGLKRRFGGEILGGGVRP